jgi:hypothetical protein
MPATRLPWSAAKGVQGACSARIPAITVNTATGTSAPTPSATALRPVTRTPATLSPVSAHTNASASAHRAAPDMPGHQYFA